MAYCNRAQWPERRLGLVYQDGRTLEREGGREAWTLSRRFAFCAPAAANLGPSASNYSWRCPCKVRKGCGSIGPQFTGSPGPDSGRRGGGGKGLDPGGRSLPARVLGKRGCGAGRRGEGRRKVGGEERGEEGVGVLEGRTQGDPGTNWDKKRAGRI